MWNKTAARYRAVKAYRDPVSSASFLIVPQSKILRIIEYVFHRLDAGFA